MLPTKFRFIWPSGYREEDFKKSANQNAHFIPIGLQAWPPHAILVSDWSISKKSAPLI
jgi:hypothetical protein